MHRSHLALFVLAMVLVLLAACGGSHRAVVHGDGGTVQIECLEKCSNCPGDGYRTLVTCRRDGGHLVPVAVDRGDGADLLDGEGDLDDRSVHLRYRYRSGDRIYAVDRSYERIPATAVPAAP